MHYEATFTIAASAGADHRQTLHRLRRATELALSLQAGEFTIEHGASDTAAYWELNLERPIPDESGNLARLEVRAFHHQGPVSAQIVSRYIHRSHQGDNELPTFPPRLIRSLIDQFPCFAGPIRIQSRHSVINRRTAPEYITHQLASPQRNIPILIITRQPGLTPDDQPRLFQRSILGAGHVVVVNPDAEPLVNQAINRPTFGGKMRLVSPDVQDHHPYFDATPDPRSLIERCLTMAADPGFDAPFANAVHAANSAPVVTAEPELTPERDHLAEALNANRELQLIIDQLRQSTPEPTPTTNPATTTHRRRRSSPPIVVSGNNTANVTAMNHAVNLIRDPLRRYVVRRMRLHFGDAAEARLATTVNPRFTTPAHIRASAENSVDINDLANIVSNFQQCFNHDSVRAKELARMFREIKAIRNRASHPPVGGLTADECTDKILAITRALDYAGIPDYRRQIREIISA